MSPPSGEKGDGRKRKRKDDDKRPKKRSRKRSKTHHKSSRHSHKPRSSRPPNGRDPERTGHPPNNGGKRKIQVNEGLVKKKVRLEETRSAASPATTSTAPRGLSRYYIHQALAQGGFGIILLASLRNKKTPVAIKAVPKGNRPNIALLREKRVLQHITNKPYLCQVYSAFQNESHGFLVMEYLPGGDLEQMLEARGALDLTTTALCSAEIICGLLHLHKLGVIHRDLKAENVLIDRRGHIRLCDFGLAAENVYGGKMIRGVAGTLCYMAPEVLNNESYDHAVDWWAFGVLVYRLLTTSFPFREVQSHQEFTEVVMRNEPTYPEYIPKEGRDVLAKLLCKEKHKRLRGPRVRQEPFYKEINWEKIEDQSSDPPFMPWHMDFSSFQLPVLSLEQDPENPPCPSVLSHIPGFSFDLPGCSF